MHDFSLPDQFWNANDFGVCGDRRRLMSTTLNRQVAMQYAASGSAALVFEIQQGMVDRGAEMTFSRSTRTSARSSLLR